MAGPIIHHRAQSERSLPFFHKRNLVEASVSLLGHTYRTMVPEGTSAEELIEKVAKENGGGVARVYYPEFKTWEIVAVKMGDQLLVKGDPKRVADADFSQFPDPDSLKGLAIAYSRKSEGGIHFSLGASGIPLAVTEEQGIVFPNAEELRIGRNTSNIALWMTSVNINPQTIADLDRAYSGGVSVSADALKKIAESHGGVRSDRLLLHDNILVLNKDTGEILTSSQHAMRMEQIMVYPEGEYLPPVPEAPNTAFPFDGSIARLPYLSFKTFDGSLADHVRIQFAPLPDMIQSKAPEIPKEPTREKRPTLGFSLLEFAKESQLPAQPPPGIPPKRQKPILTRNSSTTVHERPEPLPELVIRSWLSPRKDPVRLEIPLVVLPTLESLAEEPAPEPRRKKRKDRVFSKERPKYNRPRANLPAPTVRETPKKAGKKEKPQARKRDAPKDRQKKAPKVKPSDKHKAAKIGKPRARKVHPFKIPAIRLPALRIKFPKIRAPRVGVRENIPRARKIPKITAKAPVKNTRLPARLAKPGPKKKLSKHFFYELIGLFQRKRRGRKFSTKKNSAE